MHSLSFRQKTQAVCLIRLLNHRNNLLKCQGRLKTLSYKTLLLQQLQLGILRLLLTSLRYMQYQPFLFLFILFCFARVRIGLSRPLPSWSFIRFVSPFISFMVLFGFFILFRIFTTVQLQLAFTLPFPACSVFGSFVPSSLPRAPFTFAYLQQCRIYLLPPCYN